MNARPGDNYRLTSRRRLAPTADRIARTADEAHELRQTY
jgi:hypothetical protein